MDIKEEVTENKKEINEMKSKMLNMEKRLDDRKSTYAEADAKETIVGNVDNKDTKTTYDNIDEVIKAVKYRIRIKPISLDDINRVANEKKVNGKDALKAAAIEFLNLELKFYMDELERIGNFTVSCKDNDDNVRVYLIFDNEIACDYIYRKSFLCRNENIHMFPYIPPQHVTQ